MSLVALTHRRLATVTASASTIAAVLDAFWAVVDPAVTVYSDGSTRSFTGAGATGWTWTRVQVSGVTEALYATPPGGSLSQRVIIAGRSVAPAPSPTMVAPDTFLANGLLISHALSAGAFTTWNAAAPFTSGRFGGYTRVGAAVTGFASVAVCVYETQETIWVEMLTGGTSIILACAGALYDPETTAAAAAETDGRRYGYMTSGTGLVANFLGSAGSGTFWAHATAVGGTHTYVWRPGSTLDTCARQWTSLGGQTIANFTDNAGQWPSQTMFIAASLAWVGRVREVGWSRALLYHQRVESPPGATTAYGIGWSTSSATGDALLMRY